MEIRRARPGDLEPALRVMARNFGTPYLVPSVHTLVAEAPAGHLFVAVADDVVVGTSSAVSFGPTGWVGGVTVAPEARGRRLGQALTEAALEALGEHETVSLLATPAGQPIYERLGFVAEIEYRVFGAPEDVAPAAPDGLVPASPELVAALDREATGEDRTLALAAGLGRALATPDGAGVVVRPPWPGCPVIARDPAAGAALLAATLDPGARLAAPASNGPAMAALTALARPQRSVLRMRRGARIAWRPEHVWGVFSLFFG
jgi:predicted N-acetyltransferase YhbS